jgi:hypothetical protein
MGNRQFWTVLICVALLLAGSAGAAVAAGDLAAEHNLVYSLEDGGWGDKLAITADGKGRVALTAPFISGGCIAVNELKILSITAGDDGLRTVNLLWNSDHGAPCKAAIPMKLQAAFTLKEDGRYRIRLWETMTVNSKQFRLAGEREIVIGAMTGNKSLPAGDPADILVREKEACLAAAIRAIELEMGRAQAKPVRERLQRDLAEYRAKTAAEYTLPEKIVETAWVETAAGDNASLYVEGMTKSGPWYHLAGIVGGDYGQLKPRTKYMVSYYKVYPRAYWHMASAYVCVADVK